MPLRCTKDVWTLSTAGYYKYHAAVVDPTTKEVLRAADIPGITSPPLNNDVIEWDEGEEDEMGPVMSETRNRYTGGTTVKQKQLRKSGPRVERLKELGLFAEIAGEKEPDQKVTTAEDRILADMEQRSGLSDKDLLDIYRDASVRSVRNKIELIEKLLSN